MEPIQAVGVGIPARNEPIRPDAIQPRTSPGDTAGAAPVGMTEPENAIGNLVNQVSELMTGLGDALENNQMLKLLLGLLILMALLNQESNSGNDQQNAPSILGGNGTGQGMMLQQSMTYTSISIEQTSVTSMLVLPPGGFDAGLQDSGGQIDMAV